MSVIIILLGISLVLAGGFLLAFFWSVSDGQFDDSYGPARRILYKDNSEQPTSNE
ncbi:MAG TPA: cbb3-type cytochrome oxidase assembly protein CcoS [Saprospiraceae bacterium]|nr:cbb3-type cytochrome oxidase assembly protein CcoS [Saprospiraceae bacterium]